MRYSIDPMEKVFDRLRRQRWPGAEENRPLEERLLARHDATAASVRLRHRRFLAVAAALLLFGSVGFAASGGVQKIKAWILSIEIQGEEIDVGDMGVEVERQGDELILSVDKLEWPASGKGLTKVKIDIAVPEGEVETPTDGSRRLIVSPASRDQ